MKLLHSFLILLIQSYPCYSQKKIPDTTLSFSWPTVNQGQISSDGKYVSYEIWSVAQQHLQNKTHVVKSVTDGWELKTNNINGGSQFSFDGKYIIIPLNNDSLSIIKLGTNEIRFLTDVKSFDIIRSGIIYHLKNNIFKLDNLDGTNIFSLNKVTNYVVYNNSKIAIIFSSDINSKKVILYNPIRKKYEYIGEGSQIEDLRFDPGGNKIAYLNKSKAGLEIWISEMKNGYVARRITTRFENDSTLEITHINNFTLNGEHLFLILSQKNNYKRENYVKAKSNVEIFNYKDSRLRFKESSPPEVTSEFTAVLNLNSGKIMQLEKGNEKLENFSNDIAIVSCKMGNGIFQERRWNNASKEYLKIISLHDGSEEKININLPVLSPTGKYLLNYDTSERSYFIKDLKSGITANITKGINTTWTEFDQDINGKQVVDILGQSWINNDSILLLHDQFDIWQVDPSGKSKAINLTNGLGKREQIFFTPQPLKFDLKNKKEKSIMVPAFNYKTKENGFYWITLGKEVEPQKIIMDSYVYYVPHGKIRDGGEQPIKAENSPNWLIKRMNASESPNYFITKDFQNFQRISDNVPEKDFKSMTTELHTWKDSAGVDYQGILYKPKSFNPNKRYPIIFYYYEKVSDNLNCFIQPELFNGPLNIPWFVSRDYLVFTPDIHYTIGATGESALKAVTSAAEYMESQPYVDGMKMGIQGHSFGGYETNYIVTHSKLFAAACSASGIVNIISAYGSIDGAGGSFAHAFESSQFRMGITLWDSPNVYIKNSPIFNLNYVTTPLLIMHTRQDGASLLSQAIELFSGLRRLGKKSWLLLYDNENHVLTNPDNIKDYTTKLTEFFDFYLKGEKEPLWMTEIN